MSGDESDVQMRMVEALEKIAGHCDLHLSTLCPRCTSRCSACDSSLPVLPALPELWKKAFVRWLERKLGTTDSGLDMEEVQKEFEKVCMEEGYDKDSHGRWVTDGFLKDNPHMRRKADD